MNDIERWLSDLGLARYARSFSDNAIEWELVPDLTDSDLAALGVLLGHRKQLLKAIAALKRDITSTASLDPISPFPQTKSTATSDPERRYLSVIYCDMVGSTSLSQRLDPEDLRNVMLAFHDAVAGEVIRFEGYVARFLGDAVLAYFGFPGAREDDVERALRAGLAAIRSVAALESPTHDPLAVRVGVATGPVVVGKLITGGAVQESAAVGATPNLAVRLQGIAEPNTLVIDLETKQIAGDAFQYQSLGRQLLKGFSKPIQAWSVGGVRQAATRFEAKHRHALTPFIGRRREMEMLLQRWRKTSQGEGQTVLIRGEPGIGKSRLTQEFRQRVAGESHVMVRYQCSPRFRNSALQPFIEQLGWASGFAPKDNAERQLDKLEAMLRLATDDTSAIAPLFAELLSIPSRGCHPALEVAPERWKERIFSAFLQQMTGLAAKQPLIVVFEDAHWIDPTSHELLDRCCASIADLPVLLLVTSRLEFKPMWAGQAHTASLTLDRMGPQEQILLMQQATEGKKLPDGVVAEILEKSDGVPLFVEELTRAVLASDAMREKSGCYVVTRPFARITIPATLQASLAARLNSQGISREVVQVGALIGRAFSHRLVSMVSGIPEIRLIRSLRRLEAAGLISTRGVPPDVVYVFKHTLVQEAAYESVLRSKRQHLHRRVVMFLERQFPDVCESQPELIAHHAEEGELVAPAVEYWRRAGERSVQRGAYREAVSHLEQGLALIQRIPEENTRALKELELLIAIGVPLRLTKGVASQEMKDVYERARGLCQQLQKPRQEFPVLWGLWAHYRNIDFRRSYRLSHELQVLAENQRDTAFLVQAHHAQWTTQFFQCDWSAAISHCEAGIAHYNPGLHWDSAAVYGGHDPGVCGHGIKALCLCLGGYAVKARACLDEALRLGKGLSQETGYIHALEFAVMLMHLLRDPIAAKMYAGELIAIGEVHALQRYTASGKLLYGWAMSTDQQDPGAMALVREGLDVLRTTGFPLPQTYFMGVAAEAAANVGLFNEAQALMCEALRSVDRQGVRYWEPELHRLRGDILLLLEPGQHTAAETDYRRGLDAAMAQSARYLELRTAISLARLWRQQSRNTEAYELLNPVFAWFTEGFDAPDLLAARNLLTELGESVSQSANANVGMTENLQFKLGV